MAARIAPTSAGIRPASYSSSYRNAPTARSEGTPPTVVVAPASESVSVPASSSAPQVADDDRRVLDELDRVRGVVVDAEDAALVVARLGGPRQPPGDQTIRIASPPVFASLEVAPTSFEGAGLRVVVRLRAPIALGVLASRGAVFERDPAAGPDGRVTYVAVQAHPTRPFDLFTSVTFPREPLNLAAALIDSVTVVRRAPLGYH